MYYYSLKTKTEEHVLEPRTDGDYSYGVFDKSAELIKKKEVISKHDIFEFIYKKQASLKGKFVKVEMETVKETPKEKEKDTKSTERVIGIETEVTDTAVIQTKSIGIPSEEYEKTKDKFSIKAEINLKTNDVVIGVDCSPPKTQKETQKMSFTIMETLVPSIILALPEIVDHAILAGASNSTNHSLSKVSEAYKETELKNTVREIIKENIIKVLKSKTYETN